VALDWLSKQARSALSNIASERKWVIAVYLITVFIALPTLIIIVIGVL
jgi:sodium-dependent phosphate cotransporter